MLLVASVLLSACAGTPGHRAPGRYGLDLDSASASCRQNPLLCAKLPGEPPVVPPSGAARVVATAGLTGQVVARALAATEQARIHEALKECADRARAEVLLRTLGRSPTLAECNEVLSRDSKGQPRTRAMLLGVEMHKEALACTETALNDLRPGQFSLEPCYRYDRSTGRTTLIDADERRALLRQGRSCELVGSLVPDVVLHLGNPLQIQAVYDFKFPCVSSDKRPTWREYPPGHPHGGTSQGEIYAKALSPYVFQVVPHLGVLP
ncbi:hypothetical protein P2318_32780 [Myxococcaceae bacterium GXIMD 01537]